MPVEVVLVFEGSKELNDNDTQLNYEDGDDGDDDVVASEVLPVRSDQPWRVGSE